MSSLMSLGFTFKTRKLAQCRGENGSIVSDIYMIVVLVLFVLHDVYDDGRWTPSQGLALSAEYSLLIFKACVPQSVSCF